MKRFIEIENNIGKFIEDYHRNYNFTRADSQALEEDNNKNSLLKQLNQNSNDHKYDTKTSISLEAQSEKCLRHSLSLSSINSQLIPYRNDQMNKWSKRNCKSESDLFDLLNNTNYIYYFDELSNDNPVNYDNDFESQNLNEFIVIITEKDKNDIE